MKRLLVAASLAAMAFGATSAQAVVDVVEAPTGYFVPDDSLKYNPTYWREGYEDWGWQHSAIAGTITSAFLNISAFDVDLTSGEIDHIYALDGATWVLLGSLDGSNDTWDFTNFALGANFYDDIALGLQVRVDIDVANEGWNLTLGKSTLTTEGEDPGDPTPGVPEPSTWAMMIGGLGIAGGLLRRRRTALRFA